ncbi:type II toxin-antitoxin system PemK/MazF family toxin [Paenibacillus taichungensis]
MNIRRRDVFLADLSPVVGSEHAGVSNVLIIQNDVGNKYSPTVIVAVISDKSRKWQPTHVSLVANECGLDNNSTIFLEQIRTIDKARLGDKCTTLSLKHMEKVNYALGVSVGLREIPTKVQMNRHVKS